MFFGLTLMTSLAVARPSLKDPNAPSRPDWMLAPFLELADRDPARLIRLTQKLYSSSRIRSAKRDPALAFEWQHRLAAISALTRNFDPERRIKNLTQKKMIRTQSVRLIEHALMRDPSLIVRDGAAESIRRVIRMRPAESAQWKKILENAFLDSQNSVDGEGFFIRETILAALHEGALPLSPRVRRSAERDLNEGVRSRLRDWKTALYD
jgi:hypothetical protein